MALTVTMPQLGESVTEGTIARWLKHPGDAIAKYESIAEVITDKVENAQTMIRTLPLRRKSGVSGT